jgi:murein DD-endopeptidase MepM/ murein hydrolase activator NlpD
MSRGGAVASVVLVTAVRTATAHTLAVLPPAVPIGGLAVVRVDAHQCKGSFDGQHLQFFSVAGSCAALVGVDLDHRAGRYAIEVEAGDGERLQGALDVEAREFPEERLTVPKTYTEPDAPTLRRIAREQRLLAALWSASVPQRLWSGSFARPTDGPAGSPFGLRRFFNGEPRSPHAGIDFRAPQGTPVYAANRGRVALARELFFTGNTVVIDHGCGVFTLYVHLSKLAVRRGALVEKGQTIGNVGMTGRATGPHLHFAARIGEARIDPAALLDRDFEQFERGGSS